MRNPPFWKNDCITIFLKQLNNATDLLSFFHEIGHTHDNDRAIQIESLRDTRSLMYFNQPDINLALLYDQYDLEISAERDAWTFALRTIRMLERKYDITILKRIGTAKDVRDKIHFCLNTYEEAYAKLF